jgi:type IV secretory pathway TrbF-like protein
VVRLVTLPVYRPWALFFWWVKWKELAFERRSLASTSRWTAILTVAVKPPRSAEVLRRNPLGLYVEAISQRQIHFQ